MFLDPIINVKPITFFSSQDIRLNNALRKSDTKNKAVSALRAFLATIVSPFRVTKGGRLSHAISLAMPKLSCVMCFDLKDECHKYKLFSCSKYAILAVLD